MDIDIESYLGRLFTKPKKPKRQRPVQKLRGGVPYTPQHFTPEEGGVAPRP